MIQVLKVNRRGSRIISYTCTDGKQTLDLSRESLIKYINKGVVLNAYVKIYSDRTVVKIGNVNKDRKEQTNKIENTHKNKESYIVNYDNYRGIDNIIKDNYIITFDIKLGLMKYINKQTEFKTNRKIKDLEHAYELKVKDNILYILIAYSKTIELNLDLELEKVKQLENYKNQYESIYKHPNFTKFNILLNIITNSILDTNTLKVKSHVVKDRTTDKEGNTKYIDIVRLRHHIKSLVVDLTEFEILGIRVVPKEVIIIRDKDKKIRLSGIYKDKQITTFNELIDIICDELGIKHCNIYEMIDKSLEYNKYSGDYKWVYRNAMENIKEQLHVHYGLVYEHLRAILDACIDEGYLSFKIIEKRNASVKCNIYESYAQRKCKYLTEYEINFDGAFSNDISSYYVAESKRYKNSEFKKFKVITKMRKDGTECDKYSESELNIKYKGTPINKDNLEYRFIDNRFESGHRFYGNVSELILAYSLIPNEYKQYDWYITWNYNEILVVIDEHRFVFLNIEDFILKAIVKIEIEG